MSGIYIPGMEMPKGGYRTIEIGIDADGHPIAICDDGNVYDVIPIVPSVSITHTVKQEKCFLETGTTAPTAGARWTEARHDS